MTDISAFFGKRSTSRALRTGLSRRRWLQVSSLGWLASSLPALHSRAGTPDSLAGIASGRSRIRSCILVFHYGGPSQLETLDPKPLAPDGVRSEYGTIATAVPGTNVTDMLPRIAQSMKRIAILRSMHHPMRNHNAAAAEVLTGRTPAGGDQELLADDVRSYPTIGSAVSFGLQGRGHLLPYVALPYTIYNVVQLPGQTAGLLGSAYDRFQVTGDPNSPTFRLDALDPRQRTTRDLAHRNALLQQLSSLPRAGELAKLQVYQERALELLSSESVRSSFRIEREAEPLRDRYGRTLLGQSLLLARRLVESGVNFVTVFDGRNNGQLANWDSHETIFPRHKELIPRADQGVSALIEDLADRGLLDSTLVVAMGEFGRTPRINGNAGRDHWPDCFSVLLAGGGVQGGAIFGASDRIAAYPERDPVTPADLVATILWRFGIAPYWEVRDQTDRPIRLSDGHPITSLFH